LAPQKSSYDVIIAGGGLAGLTASILLAQKKLRVLLVEKKEYPFHKVCGEYISNEVLNLLRSIGFDPFEHGAASISKLRISTPSGKNIYADLGLGGFGLSRYTMDAALANLAIQNEVEIIAHTKVTDILFRDNHFDVTLNSGEHVSATFVIGSYGKRDVLDKKLDRDFIRSHTGYLAVKYHVRTNYPLDEVGLDNFEGGYCGIVKIENDRYNLCYLYKKNPAVEFSSIPELEQKVLFKNPVIKNIFSKSEFLFDEPEVINEISFAPKRLIEKHILMCGDSAGLITPLCGNGMAIAIHSGKLLSELIPASKLNSITLTQRLDIESSWQKTWNDHFRNRLNWGRKIQAFFGRAALTGMAIQSIHRIPPLERFLIAKTHGTPVDV